MNVRRIAVFALILYAAIFVAGVYHNHLTERPGSHCNICQALHAPTYATTFTLYVPTLTVQEFRLPEVQNVSPALPNPPWSERAPPTL